MYEGVSIIHAKSSWQLLGPEQLGMILGPLYILAPHITSTAQPPKYLQRAIGAHVECVFSTLYHAECFMVGGEIGAD